MSLSSSRCSTTNESSDINQGVAGLTVNSSSASSVVIPALPPLDDPSAAANWTGAAAPPPAMDEETDQSQFLEFPRNYFGEKSGSNPRDGDAAALLWPFRMGRLARLLKAIGTSGRCITH